MTRLPREDLAALVADVGPLWSGLRGARIFLTGGTGFFGVWLVESFLAANAAGNLGATLTVLTRDPAVFLRKYPHLNDAAGLVFHAGDVRDFVFPEGRFTHVVHAATPVGVLDSAEAAWETLDIILAGTRRVLDFCAANTGIRLLMTSSGAVYGPQPADLAGFPETWPGAPDTTSAAAAYGEGKRAAETLCFRHARLHGYEARIARCFAFAGPGMPLDGHLAAGNFIRDALAGRAPAVTGNPATVRSYLYAGELAQWLWTLLLAESAPPVVNVGSDVAITIGELAVEVARALGAPVPAIAPATAPGTRYVPDVSLAAASLGLRPRIPLDEALRRTARHARIS